MLLLQCDNTQVHQCACLKKLVAAPAAASKAGLQYTLCIVELPFLDEDNPLGTGDLRAQKSLWALALGLQRSFFRVVKMAESSLRDRAKDLSIHFGFGCGTGGKRLLKEIQRIVVFTLIDEHLG
jgi:hypothetical protein